VLTAIPELNLEALVASRAYKTDSIVPVDARYILKIERGTRPVLRLASTLPATT
jgi:hypothetical protein